MLINCSRGCGYAIEVPMDMVELATKNHQPIDAAHPIGECPGQKKDPAYLYMLRVSVERFAADPDGDDAEPVVLIRSGAEVHGDSLSDVMDRLTADLQKQWEKAQEMRYVAEQ